MPRDGQQFIARLKLVGTRRFKNEVFFVLQHLFGIGQIGERHAVTGRGIGRNRLVTQIDSHTVGSWPADDASEQPRGRRELHVGKHGSVTDVVENASARTAFDCGVVDGSENWKRTGSTGDDARNRIPFFDQFISQGRDGVPIEPGDRRCSIPGIRWGRAPWSGTRALQTAETGSPQGRDPTSWRTRPHVRPTCDVHGYPARLQDVGIDKNELPADS